MWVDLEKKFFFIESSAEQMDIVKGYIMMNCVHTEIQLHTLSPSHKCLHTDF